MRSSSMISADSLLPVVPRRRAAIRRGGRVLSSVPCPPIFAPARGRVRHPPPAVLAHPENTRAGDARCRRRQGGLQSDLGRAAHSSTRPKRRRRGARRTAGAAAAWPFPWPAVQLRPLRLRRAHSCMRSAAFALLARTRNFSRTGASACTSASSASASSSATLGVRTRWISRSSSLRAAARSIACGHRAANGRSQAQSKLSNRGHLADSAQKTCCTTQGGWQVCM